MRRIVLTVFVAFIALVLAIPVEAKAEVNLAQTEVNLSKCDLAKIITAIYPQCAKDPKNLDRLIDYLPFVGNCKGTVMKAEGEEGEDGGDDGDDIEISYEDLLKLLQLFGLTEDDLIYIRDTVWPLYEYTIDNRNVPADADMTFTVDTVSKAPHDGCFFSIGNENNFYDYTGLDEERCELCKQAGGKVKTNGAYPWGVVQVGYRIFWGTVNNILCMPSWESMTSLSGNTPYQNDCWVCEYQRGTRKDAGKSGDIERPRVYMYNTMTGFVKDITPKTTAAPVLDDCLGLRSAGTCNGVVFIGGPGLDSDQGQTSTSSAFLAFDKDGNYLGCSDMQNIDGCKVTDVRRWVVQDGILYVGVAITTADGVNKGAILRWYGDKNDPFQFHVVGYTANEAGEICYHNGRMYAGGWPTSNLRVSAIFEGPEIPEGGYTPENATEWPIMWSMAQYEPNSMNLQMEQCSLLRSYKGKLYWSMWYVQYGLPLSLKRMGVDLASPKGIAVMLAMLRQATLWRADTEQKNDAGKFSAVEMLYGEDELPNYNYMTGEVSQPAPNVSGYEHVYGRAGFDRQFTAYMWASEIYNDQLYIGTMSTEQLLEPATSNNPDTKTQLAMQILTYLLDVQEDHKGFELYRFKDGESAAETVTEDGFGNHTQYGIRNMVLTPDKSDLVIGTASPMNLMENGGWHMLRFHDNDFVSSIKNTEFKPASILINTDNGYMTFSSLNGEKIQNIKVCDLTGRQIYSENPVNSAAYLFNSQVGTGVYIVTVTTATGSWTTKVTMK